MGGGGDGEVSDACGGVAFAGEDARRAMPAAAAAAELGPGDVVAVVREVWLVRAVSVSVGMRWYRAMGPRAASVMLSQSLRSSSLCAHDEDSQMRYCLCLLAWQASQPMWSHAAGSWQAACVHAYVQSFTVLSAHTQLIPSLYPAYTQVT